MKNSTSLFGAFGGFAAQLFLVLFALLTSSSGVWGQTTETFSTAGTYNWVCPAGVTSVDVEAWGAGGAGGGTNTTMVSRAGGGGGGGAYAKSTISVIPGTTYVIVVGAGGTGISAANGNNGGNSSFNTNSVVAVGGTGGLGHTASTATAMAGGNGGQASSCTGTVIFSGGNGGTSLTTPTSGGGGGGAGTSTNGGDASGATAGTGGSSGGGSGANGTTSNGNGSNSSNVGGGGSGGRRSSGSSAASSGGNGGPGKIVLTYTLPPCSGTPAPGNTIASVNPVVSGSSSVLSLQNATSGAGVTYQWKSSTDNVTYTSISGAINATYIATPTVATYYVCDVTCSGVTSTSNPLQVTLTYCTPIATSASAYISVFNTTSGLTNIANTTSAQSSNGYGNFTAQSASNYSGTSINYSSTINNVTGGVCFAIFVDWNNDFDFADAGEKVVALGESSQITTNPSGSFTVPVGTAIGNYRMRVVLSYATGTVSSCYTTLNGEVEDYTFNVVAQPTCMVPTALNSSAVSVQTATIGWTAPVSGTTPGNYDYEIRTSGAAGSGATGLVNSGTVSTNSANITGLTSNTSYSYYVRSSCGNNDFSVWSNASTFTTNKIEPTNQITALSAGAVTASAIPLTWTAAATGSQAPDGYLVKASSINLNSITDPVDGTDPSDLTAFTSNAANKKQTTGTATGTTTFTGMNAGSMYYYKVYSYTNSGSAIDFNTTSPASLAYATKPNAVSSTLTAETITASSIGFSWSSTAYLSGTNEYLIFAKAGSAITPGTPVLNPSTYTANAAFGSGTFYEADANAFCVYKGDGTTVNLTGLNPNITYHFLMYAVLEAPNSNGTYSYSSGTSVNRTTLQIPATFPYSDDFSTNNFIFIGTQTNKWAYGSVVGNPGSSIYISNNNGTSNAYTITSTSVAHAYRDIAIPAGATIAQFSFDWRGNGESSYDYLRVWLVPSTFVPTASSQITSGSGRVQVAGNFNSQSNWQSYTNNTLDVSSFANTTMRMVFEWRNDNSGGVNPPGAVDNISITLTTFTWTGATSTDWNTATNWSPNGVPPSGNNIVIPSTGITNFPVATNITIDAGSTLTLNSGAKLTVTGTLTNNGTMTIESGATLVQGASSTLAGTGTYNVKQDITGSNNGTTPSGRFWYLGSPVSSASSSAYFSSNAANVVKKRDEVNNAWTALSSGTPENLVVGQGYYTQAMGNATINFTGGLLNNGAITIGNLTRTAGQGFEGFNLVSNPYPSYLDWDAVTKTDVGNTMWYRTASGSTAGSMVFDTYVAGTGGIGTNLNGAGVSNLIPPMQSFWVRVNSGSTTGSLGLTNSMRAHFTSINGSVAGLKSTSNERDLFLRMNLLQAGKKDQIIVYVNDIATNGFDQFDGEKMMQAGMPQFYTSAAGKKITINGLNSAKKQQALPITMELPTTGVHSFVIEDLDIDNGLVWLEDKQEEIMQALEPGTVYEFYANSGINAERFVLHFQLIDNTTPINVYNEVNSSANFSGKGASVHAESAGVVVIKLPATTEGITDIQIRDAAGKLVYTGSINTLETSVQLAQANGIYYVTLNSASGVEVRKVFIQQ